MPKTNHKRRQPQQDSAVKPKKRKNVSKPVPGFGDVPFEKLVIKDQLFESVGSAREWHMEHGSTVFREDHVETTTNLFLSGKAERNERAVKLLERAVKAQVAWTQLYPLFSAMGAFELLKSLTQDVRFVDFEASNEDDVLEDAKEHLRVCEELIRQSQALQQEAEDRKKPVILEIEVILGRNEDGSGERDDFFLGQIKKKDLLKDTRGADDPEWVIKLFEAFLAGEELSIKQLTDLRFQLARVSRIVFGR